MPRNASGTYTLPLPPVQPDTTIESGWANTTNDDIAQSLTDSLSRTGQGGMVGPFRVVDGVAATPGLAFVAETGTGFYRESAGVMSVSVQGTKIGQWSSNGFALTAGKSITLPDPPAAQTDAANKAYVDGVASGSVGVYLPLAGGTLTGPLGGTAATFSGNVSASGLLGVSATLSAGVTAPSVTSTTANLRLSNSTQGINLNAGVFSPVTPNQVNLGSSSSGFGRVYANSYFSLGLSLIRVLTGYSGSGAITTDIPIPQASGDSATMIIIGGVVASGVSWSRAYLLALRSTGGAAPDVAAALMTSAGDGGPSVTFTSVGGVLTITPSGNNGPGYVYCIGA